MRLRLRCERQAVLRLRLQRIEELRVGDLVSTKNPCASYRGQVQFELLPSPGGQTLQPNHAHPSFFHEDNFPPGGIDSKRGGAGTVHFPERSPDLQGHSTGQSGTAFRRHRDRARQAFHRRLASADGSPLAYLLAKQRRRRLAHQAGLAASRRLQGRPDPVACPRAHRQSG